jgi:tetratricopeptide (TPR) repeat protein
LNHRLPTGPCAILLLLSVALTAAGQNRHGSQPASSTLEEHYRAAEDFQTRGDLAQAEFQYKLFLSEALHRVANGRAQTGEYTEAVPLFDQALAFTPGDIALETDYAEAAVAARDLPTAQRLAGELIAASKNMKDSRVAHLHWLLGEALLGLDDNHGAKAELEAAAAIDPSYGNEYALAEAYLALLDNVGAARIFARLLARFGDTAQLHMEFGLAYGNADFPEQAIPEFRKVLAKDDKMPDAHYSLGASYLRRSGDMAFPQAEEEFHEELSIHPNDFLSYSMLGYITMNERRLGDAGRYLIRAAALNPYSTDNFLLLADLYGQLNKPTEQEGALRNAIRSSTDPSRNHYQIRGAHYQLGLLLIQRGETAEGKRELGIAQDLLLQNRKLDAANLAGKSILRFPAPMSDVNIDPGAATRLNEFERDIGPPIADSFNNLGAITAQNENYETASRYFESAAQWNPQMDGLDYNWGRAAFGARNYRQAVTCLSRYMQTHPQDNRPRVALGMSQFMLADYGGAIDTLTPLGSQLDTVPLLGYAYAESLVKVGDYDSGIRRLQRIEEDHPDLAVVPLAIGKALAGQGNYQDAEPQLRTAVRLNPTDADAKQNLALALVALKHEDEAQSLLAELAHSEAKSATVYSYLGKIQLEHGDARAAIASLETAAKLNPQDNVVRQLLTEAYDRERGQKEIAK